MNKQVLVTGGAGYIGSHTAICLLDQGYEVVIADDLSNASQKAVDTISSIAGHDVAFYQLDVADADALQSVFDENQIGSVIHFAGFKAVGESVDKPLMYYQNNLGCTLTLLETMERNEVFDLVFSSSATVYGIPETNPLQEDFPTSAVNPYGWTKFMIERFCFDLATANPEWKITLLRYFNPVGAHHSGDIGEDPSGIPNNLVPYALKVAVGQIDKLSIFGNDWPTPDGTGVRDYIHVTDLADGHVRALERSMTGTHAINLGTGVGVSVLEVINTLQEVSGQQIPFEFAARRPGDIAESVADPSKAHRDLGWKAEKNIAEMLSDAWTWQSKHPRGFRG